ncbi:MAG: septal ring lytic transglycosylase RlpA family protein [Balneolaceae bacterium]|nr:septal ring lytic transglycosylase RlpA family protein [Balneolaceae bacterium]
MHRYLKGFLLVAFIFLGFDKMAFSQSETGLASWYGPGLHTNTTAGGEVFDMNELTAAHPTLPFDTRVRVTNLKNKKSVIVRINDRGPFIKKRIIDISMEAARRLEIIDSGIAKVSVEVVNDEIAEHSLPGISRDSSPIKRTEIPLEMLHSILREAFPINELKRDFSDIAFGENRQF